MSVTHRNHTSSGCRAAVSAMALCLVLLAAPFMSAQVTITGLLSNFDVPNNVKDAQGNPREAEGFEIQLEGIQPADVVYAFGEAANFNALDPAAAPPAPCYIRYCRPQVIQYATGTYIRWVVSGWDPVKQQFTTRFNIPGMVVSPSTPPIAAGTFFGGHSCLAYTMTAYPTAGCEHFGVTLTKLPVATTYRWIVGNSATGVLTYSDGTALPNAASPPPPVTVAPVPILAPAAQIVLGQVEAVIKAPVPPPPPPAALPLRYGIAQWVKVYKKEIDRQADLEELVGGHPNENVPGILGDNRDPNAVAETEWKLLQLDTCNPDKGGSQLVNHGGSSHGVVRRYEFYKYAGPVVAPGGSAKCGSGTRFSTDNQEASLCQRDPITLECLAPGPGDLGDFMGAQNAAQNLNLNDGTLPQAITFAALSDHLAGDPPLTLDATGGGSGNPVTFSAVGNCSVAGQTLTLNGVGMCAVTAYQAGNAAFAPAADVLRSFFINSNKATQKISFNPLPGPFKYGDPPFQVSATSSSGLTVAFAASGACSVQGTTVTIIAAGECDVTASQAGDANFGPAAPVLEFTNIAKATVNITADHLTKVYGMPDPPLTFSAIGFVGGDTASVLSGALTRTAGEAVGAYSISQGTLAATNYTINFTSSTLDITPAAATVTAGSGAKTYGSADPPITASASGFLATDGITVSATRAPGENVGAYVTTATASGAALANYTVTFVNGSFSITPAAATVTAGNGTKAYGSADPPITASATGFLATDGITVSATRAPGENVGTYVTTATASGAALANYTVTFVAGSFSITPAAATVTAGNGTKTYGSPDPAITASATGFLATDGITVSATRAPGENVGAYVTTATASGAALANYTVTFVNGSFSITPAAATVTAGNGTKIYGSPDPAITASATGFLATDGITVSATRAPGENVGTYVTTATASGAALANYTVTFVNGSFSITPAAATVTAGNGSKTYGTPDPAITASASGFLAADGITVSATRAPGENVGTYVTTATASGAALTNYTVTFVAGSFSIIPAVARVVAGSGTKTFGSPDPPITAIASGFLATDAITVSATRVPGENVGTYVTTATASGAALTNYTVIFVNGSFTITQAPSTVTVSCPVSVVFTGSPLTPCTATFTTAGLSGPLTVTYTNNTAIGTAQASATYAGDANHLGSTGTSSFLIVAPPAAIMIVNPGPQVNREGDTVALSIQVVRVAPDGTVSPDTDKGVFDATGLPGGLRMSKGVIRGKVAKGTAGAYQVTVTFTQGGVTVSQTFGWTILPAGLANTAEDRDEATGSDDN